MFPKKKCKFSVLGIKWSFFHQSYPFMKGLVSFNNVIYDNIGACVAIEKHFGKKAFLRYDKRVTI